MILQKMIDDKYIVLSIILVFMLFIAACQPVPAELSASTQEAIQATPDPDSPNESIATTANEMETGVETESTPLEQPADNHEQTGVAELLPTPAITPRPIVVREVPVDFNWKQLPIMPEISENAFAIYQYGLALGRNPKNISVIGDCQAIPFVFLGKYGLKQYSLEAADLHLEKMIAYYRDSFEREGNAVRGGFTAAAVLSSVRADPDLCVPGETPLDCEWREHNPSIAFINLETWREEGTVDRYELYLEKIVEYSLERGTLPIIIMKADKAEAETHVINPAMARVAYRYDVPIINFWQAAQYLDNLGIDPEREGFHLSEAGYDRKQILALRTLYRVWSQTNPTLAQENTQEEETTQEQPAMEAIAEIAPMPKLNFQCEGSCIYYDLLLDAGTGIRSQGITELNTETQVRQIISDPDIILQDVSLDQQFFLIHRDTSLYLVERSTQETRLILDNLFPDGGSSAYFSMNTDAIIALITGEPSNQIIRYDLASETSTVVFSAEISPIRLIQYRPKDGVYWESGSCPAKNFCKTDAYWYTAAENGTTTLIEGKEHIVFSPQGENTAFRDPIYADEFNYYHNPVLLFEETAIGITSRRLFGFPHPGGFRVHPEVSEYVFSPNGTKIFVLFDEYSDYFEKSLALHFYVEDIANRMVFEHGVVDGAFGSLKPQVVWSPDGNEVFLLLVNTPNDRDYSLDFYRKNTDDRFSELIPVGDPITLDGYAVFHRAFWIKDEQ